MPVRDYSDNGVVRTAVGASDPTGAFSVAVLVKLGVNQEWLWARNSSTIIHAPNWTSFGCESSNLRFYPSNSVSPNPPRGEWILIVGACPAGTARRKYFIYRFGSEQWIVQEDAGTASAPVHIGTPDLIQLGRWNSGEQFDGRYAACAVFTGELTKSDAEDLIAGSIEDWLTKEPLGLWMFNQESVEEEVVDSTGNGADQVSRVGTTVAEEDPPIPYGEGGGASPAGVKMKVGGVLVAAKRWIKVGGELLNR
jgi:hypothetical protein